MKFVTAIAAGVVASSALAQAEDTRYAQLQKEYEALAPRLEEMGFGEIGSFGMGNLGPITGLNKLDTNALRRAGMTDLADSLDSLGEKSLAAGYKGLAALTALADGDFAKAQQYGNEANNMLPDSTSLGFLSDFGFGDSATADNIATKAAATIVSQQPAQPAKVVASPVVRTILNTAQNPVYYSGYQGYTRPTYTTSYLVPTASATQYAQYY
jgi:hypothetical protein